MRAFGGTALPEFDSCGLATFLAVVTALASVADPPLAALTGALVALSLAAFLMGMRPRHGGRLVLAPRALLAVSILGGGTVAFLELPAELAMGRGILLAASATPLWWAHRSAGSARPSEAA